MRLFLGRNFENLKMGTQLNQDFNVTLIFLLITIYQLVIYI